MHGVVDENKSINICWRWKRIERPEKLFSRGVVGIQRRRKSFYRIVGLRTDKEQRWESPFRIIILDDDKDL